MYRRLGLLVYIGNAQLIIPLTVICATGLLWKILIANFLSYLLRYVTFLFFVTYR